MTAEAIQSGILDITNEEHHALRALSNSGMKDLAVSPLRYWFLHINPAPKPEEEETAALRIGSALHCAVLESEEAFESRYACAIDASDWPVCLDTVQEIRQWVVDKGGKCSGTRKDDVIASALTFMGAKGEFVPILAELERVFYAQNAGKTILQKDEWERVAGMSLALAEEPALKPILTNGRSEVSMVATHPDTGVLMKARLDWISECRTIVDLKTFTQKRGKSIDKSISDAIYYEAYHRQAYTYDLVYKLAHKEAPKSFVYAFVESDPPHEVRLRRMVPRSSHSVNLYWESARIETERLIHLYGDCMAKFGDKPWKDQQEISRLTDEDVPRFSYGSF